MRTVVYACDWCNTSALADDRDLPPSNWCDIEGTLLCPDCVVARERAIRAAMVARAEPVQGQDK